MSDDPFILPQPTPLMSALKARDLGRAHKAWATYLHVQGLQAEAVRAERDAKWWLTYSIALSQVSPGAIDQGEG